MAEDFDLKLALGTIPLFSPCLHIFILHTKYLPPRIYKLLKTSLTPRRWKESSESLVVFLPVYLFKCTNFYFQIQPILHTHIHTLSQAWSIVYSQQILIK